METQTWLSCHNRFISAENITLLSVSSDDFLHAILKVEEQQMSATSTIACKKSSDETESRVIFSAEINLLWQLNQVWVYI